MTGITAEKHDAFSRPPASGGAIAEFCGKELVKGEPDAIVLPLRRPARDVRGPRLHRLGPHHPRLHPRKPQRRDPGHPHRLCLLDRRGPRQEDPAAPLHGSPLHPGHPPPQALRQGVQKVFTTVGPEQEYFLIDRNFYFARPDLIDCRPHALRRQAAQGPGTGRPIFRRDSGARAGLHGRCRSTNSSSSACRSRPATTKSPRASTKSPRSSKTATSPTDHQMLIMETLRRIADKYGLACLLHEKPFAGINGSGKHNNWSMATDEGENLLNPGDTPHENAQFLIFCVAVIRAVDKYAGLLRVGDRLAPATTTAWGPTKPRRRSSRSSWAISSTTSSTSSKKARASSTKQGGMMETGVTVLPKLPKDAGDRNRTSPSPLPATSSSSARCRPANHRRAQHHPQHHRRRIARLHRHEAGKGRQGRQGPQQGHPGTAPRHHQGDKKVIFNGDDYTEAWHTEAEKRGLPNFKNTVDACRTSSSKETIDLFTKYKVYTETRSAQPLRDPRRELHEDGEHRRPRPP